MSAHLSEDARDDALRQITEAYESYGSGRSARWEDIAPGSRLARAQRDEWLAEAAAPSARGGLLDLGCGDGFLARLLDDHGLRPQRYLGVDLIDDRLDVARALSPWATFVKASADRVPTDDGWADVATLVTVLSSVRDPGLRHAIVQEMDRIVRPGGRLVVYDLRYPSPGNPHVHAVSMDELTAMLPGWTAKVSSLTVLPPLARSPLAGGRRRYALLHQLPLLRSHVAAILVKP